MWAAVPLKSPDEAKSRLQDCLDAASRRRLFLAMARHTIRTLVQTPGVAGVAAVTASSEVAALAGRHGAMVLMESGDRGTACACRTAVEQLADRANSLLLISGDLPLLSADALAGLVALRDRSPLVAVVPDRHGRGTNALLCAPPGVIPILFGPNSCERHLAAAREARIALQVIASPSLALDIDDAEDLEELRRRVRAEPGILNNELGDALLVADEVPAQ